MSVCNTRNKPLPTLFDDIGMSTNLYVCEYKLAKLLKFYKQTMDYFKMQLVTQSCLQTYREILCQAFRRLERRT